MNDDPSAGNKAGGLTTVLEKLLSGVIKAGTTNLVDVYEYAEPVTAKGFVVMDTPDYDPVTVTGQVAGGADLIWFTTGRGSAFGFMPTPSLKLATDTMLWNRQQENIDINCGGVIDGNHRGGRSQDFQMVLDCASGTRSKGELHGSGQNEFVPWQTHHSSDHPHPDLDRGAAHLGLQPKLGLCPEWWGGVDCDDPDHPFAHGPPLTAERTTTQPEGPSRPLSPALPRCAHDAVI